MDAFAHALKDVPVALHREITRFGGLNPFGKPLWRVVLAQNVLEQSFGVMRHMPCVSADAMPDNEIPDVEPERIETGEFWTPRYSGRGWILERWFPASVWGSLQEWRLATAEDGETRMMGAFPRHGDYYMVSDVCLPKCPSVGYWKTEIGKELRRMTAMHSDPSRRMNEALYMARIAEERRKERFTEEVNSIHRSVTAPILATVGRTAQCLRDGLAEQIGLRGNLAAG
jgi:hypothetical protein